MGDRVRLADLLAGLSIAADLGYRLPVETALRSCLIGTVLGREMELPERDVAEVFYVSLLFHVGCVAYSHETAALFGDDLTVNRAVAETDLSSARDIFTTLIPGSTRGLRPTARLRGAVRMATGGPAFGKAHNVASCEVARAMALRIGLDRGVSDGLYDIHERWDGRGARGLVGPQMAQSARIARVASEASELVSLGAGDDVVSALQRRAGRTLCPEVVARLSAGASRVLAEGSAPDPRARLLEVEPQPVVDVAVARLAPVARAFGDMADLKTPFTHGHASGVARLASNAAERLGMDSDLRASLEIAALLHDLGRIGVSNAVWEKPGELTGAEWDQVRLHPYYSERILAAVPALAVEAEIVGAHHERLDGSGYHRGSRARELGSAARVLSAADAFQAMTQSRPHRGALSADQAGDALVSESRAGRFDTDAVSAVLDAAGQSRPRPAGDPLPRGLTGREVEVLELVAQGCSNAEIGHRLGISRRTAEHHVQHIYQKIGASSRAAAALFALEHDLLPRA